MGYDNELSDTVVIDIETVASPDVEHLLDPVRAPSTYKDPFKILTYVQDKTAERIATASLEADLCEIVALGYQRGTDCQVLTRANSDEPFLLEWFWAGVSRRRLIGYNSLQFDLPVLIRRSQLLGVEYPSLNIDKYRSPHIDLLQRLSFNGALTFRSLAFYCRRFSIPCDDTVLGSEIPQLVADGNWDAVRSHCEADIRKTALLAARLGFFQMVGSEVA